MNIPKEWTFNNKDVASSFDNHVREQLPWYDLCTKTVVHLVRNYLPEGGTLYDIGASTGNIGSSINTIIEQRNAAFFALESSKEMIEQYRGPDTLIHAHAADYDYKPFDVAICFLVLMFLTCEDRKRLLSKLRATAKPGAAIIIFDKTEFTGGYLGTIMQRLTLSAKLESGASSEQIIQKELSLSGVQRPICLEKEIPNAIEIFRFGEFGGWVITI